jgi:hypothetical protein
MTAEMSAELQQTLSQAMESIQTQRTGFMSTQGGQRLIQETITAINNDLFLKQINCAVTEVTRKIFVQNEIVIYIGDRTVVNADSCRFVNDVALKYASTAIIANTIDAFMDLKVVTDYFSSMSAYQENLNLGISIPLEILIVGGVILALVIIMLTVGIKYGAKAAPKIFNSRGFMIFCVVVGLITIGGSIGGFFLEMSKREDEKQKKIDEDFPPCTEDTCPPPV